MSKKVVFVVQGEGRGHLSQALAMKTIVTELNYKICKVYVGRNSQRKLPSYFTQSFSGLISEFASPNFLIDQDGKGIKVAKSLWHSFLNLPKYIYNSIWLATGINRQSPDLVISFYEPLVGLSQIFKRIKAPIVTLAHQYLSLHPSFQMPKKPRFDKNGLKVLSYISQIGSSKVLALSFYEFEDCIEKKITVVPPLLRDEVVGLNPETGDFYLVYLLNRGYANDIIQWQKQNPSYKLAVFWDNYEKPNEFNPQVNLWFYHLNAQKFLSKMSTCKALISTAGFESVSEALSLGKKVAVVPVKGHYEQKLNSFDVLETRAAFRNDEFEVDKIMLGLSKVEPPTIKTRDWIKSGNIKVKQVLSQFD
ncbi:MAG: glycosyltransferase family protein [Bacteroidia bacterium]